MRVGTTEDRLESFEVLSEDQKWEVWRARQEHLWRSFILNPRGWRAEITIGCGMCFGPGHCPKPQSWPQAFECVCGAVTIADRRLADGAERFSMFSEGALTTYAKFIFREIKNTRQSV
jgi:hypothetical protein